MLATKNEEVESIIINNLTYEMFNDDFRKIISDNSMIAWKFIKYKPAIVRFISEETYLNIKENIISEMKSNSNYFNMCKNIKNIFPEDLQLIITDMNESKMLA